MTGGMGGIGTSLCQRLHKDGFTVIAGCGPSRDHAKWLGEQAALGFAFTASAGNVGVTKQVIDEVLDKIVANIPIKRLGTPQDIASIVSWVASEESGFATGADFSVNGGLHMG